jgi:outer membrane protein TolC
MLAGCRTPTEYREQADEVAYESITAAQEDALGKTEPFTIRRPGDILRRRLLEAQGLPYSSEASLGVDALTPPAHWPPDNYPVPSASADANIPVEPNQPLKLSLVESLQVGAYNSPDYQSQKEDVFRSALSLDLQRNYFRNIFAAAAEPQFVTDTRGDHTVTTLETSGSGQVTRNFMNGIAVSGALAIDLWNLLTQGGASSLGLSADASVSIPLLRGAGPHIVREPLTQAERDLIYAVWDFERYKRIFAVGVARDYFGVLRQMDTVQNARENYRSAIQSSRFSRARANAGRIRFIDVDQAIQRELSARNGWIVAQAQLESRLDSFKASLGLPADALVELDPNDLAVLRGQADKIVDEMRALAEKQVAEPVPPADAPVELVPPSKEEAGPFEIDEDVAVPLALENRLDLRVAHGAVYDAQRDVVIRADALRAELTLGGSASWADNDNDGSLSYEGGRFAGLLTLDLPIERTRERNEYRNSLINLERATRSVQTLENQVKLAVRDELRALLESRETLKIQAQAVVIAEKRVGSAALFVEAGRAQIRDLLEAQDDLLSARNALTAAIVSSRITELELQRDMGVLQVNARGLWQEFKPEEINHGEAK